MKKNEILPIILVLLIGFVIISLGAMIKILHWEFFGVNGDMILFFGFILKICAIIFLIFKLFREYKSN